MKNYRTWLYSILILLGGLGISSNQAEKAPADDSTGSSQRPDPVESSDSPEVDSEIGSGFFSPKYGDDFKDKVVVVKVGMNSLMGKSSFLFLERIVKKAELEGAEALIFDMDTPGGEAWRTESLVMNGLMNTTIPTYTFVNPRAISAGAMVAIGTDKIYMRPAATIGSALAVMADGSDLSETMKDKVQSSAASMMRNVAAKKGHNPDIAEAFVTSDTKVKIGKEVIHDGKSVLNLNTVDATRIINGKPVLAVGEVDSVEELMEREKLVGPITRAEPSGMESFAFWVQMLSPVLIILGLGGAYMELKAPGFGLPGAISIISFTIFFFGNNLAGKLAGFELAVLLILGIILIGVEVFVLPGTLISGAIGIVLVIASLGIAMVDGIEGGWKISDRAGAISWGELLSWPFFVIVFGLVGSTFVIGLAMRFLPESRFGSWMVLTESVAGGASLESDDASDSHQTLVGLEGAAESDLRPAGKGRFAGKLLDITADGEFIETGTALKIVKHEGSRIVVERA